MNIYNKKLEVCSLFPLTGHTRNGYCTLNETDNGIHIVCAIMTEKFLNFSKSKGNDLITPSIHFPGLKKGDKWCLCVHRWIEAYHNDCAPYIDLKATNKNVLKYLSQNMINEFGK